MDFKVGDKVRFRHEKGEGKVIRIISAHKIMVEISEGLEIEVPYNELVAVAPISLKNINVSHKEDLAKKVKRTTSKPHAKDERVIDLHIENLTEHSWSMSNAQKLSLQLDNFQDAMEKAIRSHINKIVFIHGVGNGVLRQSIRDILKRYDGIEYSDGSYQKYGAGATEVRIISRNKAK
jgi:dsDNA-specific endonuclease/ATPase MutS2